jgi:hypothetical protein
MTWWMPRPHSGGDADPGALASMLRARLVQPPTDSVAATHIDAMLAARPLPGIEPPTPPVAAGASARPRLLPRAAVLVRASIVGLVAGVSLTIGLGAANALPGSVEHWVDHATRLVGLHLPVGGDEHGAPPALDPALLRVPTFTAPTTATSSRPTTPTTDALEPFSPPATVPVAPPAGHAHRHVRPAKRRARRRGGSTTTTTAPGDGTPPPVVAGGMQPAGHGHHAKGGKGAHGGKAQGRGAASGGSPTAP